MEMTMTMQRKTGTLAVISGVLADQFRYSHSTLDGNNHFFCNKILVKRQSGNFDIVPIIIPENKYPKEAMAGMYVEVRGTIRNYRRIDEEGHRHLDVFVYPHYLKVCKNSYDLSGELSCNEVVITAKIARISGVRETPFGRRICDFMLTTPKENNPSIHYKFPCIAWGQTAKQVSELPIGSEFNGYFRFQSREYVKREYPNSPEGEKRVAYELSLISYNT